MGIPRTGKRTALGKWGILGLQALLATVGVACDRFDPSPTPVPTAIATATPAPTPTSTAVSVATPTPTATAAPTSTSTPRPTPGTDTPTPTRVPKPTATPAPIATAVPTPTPTVAPALPGGSAEGRFAAPLGVAVDGVGNVYVADAGSNRVQVFSSTGEFLDKWGK